MDARSEPTIHNTYKTSFSDIVLLFGALSVFLLALFWPMTH